MLVLLLNLVCVGELCLVSLELSVFLLPLVLMEFYLSENVYEWHRVRDGLIAMLDDGTCSSRLTVVLLESLDFIRSQWFVFLHKLF